MHFGVAAEGQTAVQLLANRRPEEDGTGAVCPGDPSLWREGVEPENIEGHKLDNNALWDAGARHARPHSSNPFLNNSDDTFYVTNMFVVA